MKKEINSSNKIINKNQKVTASAILEKDMGTSTWNENSMPSVRVKWNGYAFYEIKLPNGKNIVIDPYYHDVDNKYILDKTKNAADIVDGCDYVLFTHTHLDHSQDFPYILKNTHWCQLSCLKQL